MKVDLVGPKRRGLAIGLNESAGYLAVSAAALASGFLAARYALRPEPFFLGMAAAVGGLALSLLTRDTRAHAEVEASAHGGAAAGAAPSARWIVGRVSWRSPSLRAVSQAGLVNNLNDGVSWGLFPLYFASAGATLREAAVLIAVYPAVWGLGQTLVGALSDRLGRKWLMSAGMVLQGLALVAIGATQRADAWLCGMICLGVGTALAYPTLLSAVSHHSHPGWRATAMGVYRLWRDLGYAVGALLAGGLADAFGLAASIGAIGAVTVLSGVVVATTYRERPAEG
jgi:MFS family permease